MAEIADKTSMSPVSSPKGDWCEIDFWLRINHEFVESPPRDLAIQRCAHWPNMLSSFSCGMAEIDRQSQCEGSDARSVTRRCREIFSYRQGAKIVARCPQAPHEPTRLGLVRGDFASQARRGPGRRNTEADVVRVIVRSNLSAAASAGRAIARSSEIE